MDFSLFEWMKIMLKYANTKISGVLNFVVKV